MGVKQKITEMPPPAPGAASPLSNREARVSHSIPSLPRDHGRLRILFVITRMDSVGGAQKHVVDVGRSAVEKGHVVHLAHGAGEPGLSASELAGFHLHLIPGLRRSISPVNDIRSVFQLRRLIRDIEPDLVSTHSSKAGVAGRIAAVWERVPNVHTAHGWAVCRSGSWAKRTIYRLVEFAVQRLADGVLCVSEADRDYAVRSLNLPGDRIAVIHNGCRDPGPGPVADGGMACESSPCRIAFVGRMAWPKQPDALLRFAAKVELPVAIDFFGGGPGLAGFVELARELRVEEKVTFHGHVPDCAERLRRCDVFALISDWEGFPLATVEAMAAGLPVVVSDVGGAGEAVIDGESGFLIPRGDEEILFDKLSLLVADRALRRKMGRAARERFLERFQVDRMTEAVLRFYETSLLQV